nr:hypothetical protein [Tanacetum cinerariifolium]
GRGERAHGECEGVDFVLVRYREQARDDRGIVNWKGREILFNLL